MKYRYLFSVAVTVVTLLGAPLLTGTSLAALSWQDTTYVVDTYSLVDVGALDDESDPAPVEVNSPVFTSVNSSASIYGITSAQGYSALEDGWNMLLTGCAFCGGEGVGQHAYTRSYAEFNGWFTAEDPVFQFSYAYEYAIAARSTGSQNNAVNSAGAYLYVYDNTSGTVLYDQWLMSDEVVVTNGVHDVANGADSGMISINTTGGHDIQVRVNTEFEAETNGYACAGNGWCQPNAKMALNYDTSVVMAPHAPEPVSSALFLAGGATFAARSLKRRKRKNA